MSGRRVLVIGGTRFMGYALTWRLLLAGHEVTLLNRGSRPDPFGDRIERITLDRTTPAFAEALAGRSFDAAVDFAAYAAEDAQGAVDALSGQVGHYILISTGSVYLVREGITLPAREEEYSGPVMPAPPTPEDQPDWEYSTGKRGAEDVLAAAFAASGFPATRLRIPVVNGERDYSGRLESYLWRILDGEPILLPDGDTRQVRHVYSGAVARVIVDILGRDDTFGQAYNIAQEEMPALTELVTLAAELMGSTAAIRSVPGELLAGAGIPPSAFPFTSRWNSLIDPARAQAELGFRHEPLPEYLGRITAHFLSDLPAQPPPFNADRVREIALARDLAKESVS